MVKEVTELWQDGPNADTSKATYKHNYLWIVQKDDTLKFSAWHQGTNVGQFDTMDEAKSALIEYTDELLSKKSL